jgi:hypothetical protein
MAGVALEGRHRSIKSNMALGFNDETGSTAEVRVCRVRAG